MTRWTTTDIPDLSGITAIVTGASSGIGEASAGALAAKGAEVVLAVRDPLKGERVLGALRRRVPDARARVMRVDLADLASIREFAAQVADVLPHVDILMNNAGLGMQPTRAVTIDGFERQFGTNHLGQFALTGLLLPALLRAPAARVVAISSLAHRAGRIDFDDLQGERRYRGTTAYNQSKLANLLFTAELDRRASAAGTRLVAVAAHPGIAATGFISAIGLPKPVTAAMRLGAQVFAQTAEQGALPGLYAATVPGLKGGAYIGPGGLAELRGWPQPASRAPRAQDARTAQRLWAASEALTGVDYGEFDARGGGK